jgi:hypothetical protein
MSRGRQFVSHEKGGGQRHESERERKRQMGKQVDNGLAPKEFVILRKHGLCRA